MAIKERVYYAVLIVLVIVGVLFASWNTLIMAWAFALAFLVLFFRKQVLDLLKSIGL